MRCRMISTGISPTTPFRHLSRPRNAGTRKNWRNGGERARMAFPRRSFSQRKTHWQISSMRRQKISSLPAREVKVSGGWCLQRADRDYCTALRVFHLKIILPSCSRRIFPRRTADSLLEAIRQHNMNATPPQGDDDSTVMPPRVSEEPVTAVSGAKPVNQNSLPIGSKLGEFEIVGLIGAGGFGIVYLAYDHSLHRQVALKEYMPAALAGRDDGVTVVVRSERNAETFQAGLRSFVNEAQLLAQFDHPSLVKVY